MASNALYISIYQELLHDIQSGKYIENEPLPSEESRAAHTTSAAPRFTRRWTC